MQRAGGTEYGGVHTHTRSSLGGLSSHSSFYTRSATHQPTHQPTHVPSSATLSISLPLSLPAYLRAKPLDLRGVPRPAAQVGLGVLLLHVLLRILLRARGRAVRALRRAAAEPGGREGQCVL